MVKESVTGNDSPNPYLQAPTPKKWQQRRCCIFFSDASPCQYICSFLFAETKYRKDNRKKDVGEKLCKHQKRFFCSSIEFKDVHLFAQNATWPDPALQLGWWRASATSGTRFRGRVKPPNQGHHYRATGSCNKQLLHQTTIGIVRGIVSVEIRTPREMVVASKKPTVFVRFGWNGEGFSQLGRHPRSLNYRLY